MLLKLVQLLLGNEANDPAVDRELNVERVSRITDLQIQVAIGYAVCIVIATALVTRTGSPDWVWFLSLPILMTVPVSLSAWYRYRSSPRPRTVRQSAITQLAVVLLLYGLLWGTTLAALALAALQDVSFILLLIAVGISSAATTMAYYLPFAVLGFGVLCVVPIVVTACWLNPDFIFVLSALFVVYFSASAHAVIVSFRVLMGNLQLRIENEKLLFAAREVSASKNRFIASMSHELRTPLNAIAGYAQLIKIGGEHADTERLRRAMDNILDASTHLVGLVDDVLDISKLESDQIQYEMSVLNPETVFAEVDPMIRSMTRGKILSFQVMNKTSERILVDRRRLRQVLINILSNAIKYTPSGGSVEYGCYETQHDRLRIFVSDNGLGIPAADQKDVFGQFHRASNVTNFYPGTGLGLYHSKRLVEDMGGTIGFESVEADGTTFYLEFPVQRNSDQDYGQPSQQ